MTDDAEELARKKMLARIRALMAKTVANGCTEEEAKLAADAVDRLMGLYEIDLTETLVQEQEVVQFEIKLDHHPVRFALANIAKFCDCKAWVQRDFLVYLGLEIDTEIAEYLTLLFQRAIDREVNNYTMFNDQYALQDEKGQAEFVHSFSVGMSSRLGERLILLKNNRDFSRKTSGFDLVAAKKPLIDEAFATLGIDLGPDRSGGRSIKNPGAYNAGRSAADGVAINHGVAGRAGGASGRIR